MHEYTAQVTRTEIHQVAKLALDKERQFQLGKLHRNKGLPCMSANGAYLDGWYNPKTDYYYIPREAAHLL